MNYPNPLLLTIASDSSYSFMAWANPGRYQRASIAVDGTIVAVFKGKGNGVPMTIADGSAEYGGATRGRRPKVSVLFEFSDDGITYSNAAVIQFLVTPTTVMVGTQFNANYDPDAILTLRMAPI